MLLEKVWVRGSEGKCHNWGLVSIEFYVFVVQLFQELGKRLMAFVIPIVK